MPKLFKVLLIGGAIGIGLKMLVNYQQYGNVFGPEAGGPGGPPISPEWAKMRAHNLEIMRAQGIQVDE